MVVHLSQSDNKSDQASRTLLSILADLSRFVIWTISFLWLIFNSSSLCYKHLRPITSALTLKVIPPPTWFIVVFSSLARSKYMSILSFCFNLTQWSAIMGKPTWMQWRCPWCNGYRRRKWTRWHEFKSWTRLIAFHIALIPLGKVWIQLFSLQLWVNSRTD